MNNRWRLIALWALPIALVAFFGLQVVRSGGPMQAANGPTEAPRNSAVARVAYGRFLDYLEAPLHKLWPAQVRIPQRIQRPNCFRQNRKRRPWKIQ